MDLAFSSSFLGALLTGSGRWTVILATTAMDFLKPGQPRVSLPYESIHAHSCTPGIVWSGLTISSSQGVIHLTGIGNSDAQALVGVLGARVADALLAAVEPHRKALTNLSAAFKTLLARPHYLANRDITAWLETQDPRRKEPVRAIIEAMRNPPFPAHRVDGNLKNQTEMVIDVLQGRSSLIKQRNEAFVLDEMEAHKAFFDEVETTLLTDEQRRAAIVMEDRNLLVAAAGVSGTRKLIQAGN